jgi:predicted O-methyltransferase YrrM
MLVTKNKVAKFGQICLYSLSHPGLLKRSFGQLYNRIAIAEGKIPICPISNIVPVARDISCKRFDQSVAGNVSEFEIVCLCALVRHLQPSLILEIGTFNGNTTLQLAANSPASSKVYTLDLPWETSELSNADPDDIAFIRSRKRRALRFANTEEESRIRCLYGDSLSVNFSDLIGGQKADLIFIDAGHSYQCVKNDSDKSFSVLNKGGVIVWHDYGASWPAVYRYLEELSETKTLRNIEGTELVVYVDDRSSND